MPTKTAETVELVSNEEKKFLADQHKKCLKLLGYLPIIAVHTTQAVFNGGYVPPEERKRQLAGATKKKRKELLMRWGMKEFKGNPDETSLKQNLRSGMLKYEAVTLKRRDTARSLELAQKLLSESKQTETEKNKSKLELIAKFKERVEKKKLKKEAKQVKKRKEAMERVMKAKREGNVSEELKARLAEAQSLSKALTAASLSSKTFVSAEERLPRTVKEENDMATPHALDSPFTFNLQTCDTRPRERSKRSVYALKAELKTELEKKQLLKKLTEKGEDELVHNLQQSLGWSDATKKAAGEKVRHVDSLTHQLSKAIRKEQNKGKKLREVLQQQKQDKHKRFLAKQRHLRQKKVMKLAKKMNKFARKGHLVPGFVG